MSGLLPQESPTDPTESDPEVVGLDETDSNDVFSTLSSGTARSILTALYESPATQSELADQVGTSIQNVDHHIENLVAADLVTVVDQWYSEKGNEMDVYAPSNGPLVVVSGNSDHAEATRNAVGLVSPSTPSTGD